MLTQEGFGPKLVEDLAGDPEEPEVVGQGGELHLIQAPYTVGYTHIDR